MSKSWQQPKRQQTQIAVLLVIALAFAVRLYHLDKQSLWFDKIVRLYGTYAVV